MVYFSVLCCLCLAYALSQGQHLLKRRRLLQRSWGDLLSELQPVDTAGIATVAKGYLHPSRTQLQIEPDIMWLMVGKAKGLQALEANAETMLKLAIYAAQWNHVEGRVVGEMIRRDGVRLKRAIRQIQLGMLTAKARKLAAFDLQEAAATYHMMRGRLLGLYEVANSGLHVRLAARL